MQWIICYDIADDRRRTHVVEALKDSGQRIQESVFAIFEDREAIDALMVRLRREVEGEDKVHCLAVCDGCWKEMRLAGAAEIPREPRYYVL